MSPQVPGPLRPRLLLGLSVRGDDATAAARLTRALPPTSAADHLLTFADELEAAMCPRMAARARRIAIEIVAHGSTTRTQAPGAVAAVPGRRDGADRPHRPGPVRR